MMQQKNLDFGKYFAGFEGLQLQKLEELRAFLSGLLPDASEAISYQIPTYKLNGKNIVHFAAYAKHIGFYPGSKVIAENTHLLDGYKFAKGSVQFPIEKPLPRELIRTLVSARLRDFQATGR